MKRDRLPRCHLCRQPMARLAEMPAVAVFACQACGATRSMPTSERVSVRAAIDSLDIALALACGWLCGGAPGTMFDELMPSSRPSVRGTVRIVRVTLVYLAIVTMTWALALSDLSVARRIAIVAIATAVGGGASAGRFPPTRARS